ncbi:MAG: Tryptophan synthase alpha chain [Chlamydiae bacterium]|nr:Tryptophan synthase alpha chain [Chlamydiota bacterium]
MNAIKELFREKQPFIGFVVGGDGGLQYCTECCLELIEGGVDILEIGLPFSDPVADGPVIQRASERSLSGGTTSATILEIARNIRKKSRVPLILFSYYNPLLKQGDSYLQDLKSAGFNGVLVVDLPPPIQNKDHPFFRSLEAANLIPIFVIAPSTEEARLVQITKIANSFLYYACRKGTTGIRNQLPEDLSFQISRIRQKTNLPIAIGFGIADPKSVTVALSEADGFVVGSAFVKLMERHADPTELKALAQSLNLHSNIEETRS